MCFKIPSTVETQQLCGYFGFLAKNYSVIRISNAEIDQFFRLSQDCVYLAEPVVPFFAPNQEAKGPDPSSFPSSVRTSC